MSEKAVIGCEDLSIAQISLSVAEHSDRKPSRN